MRVVLDAALFDPAQPNPLELVALVQLGFEGRHLLMTEPLEDARVQAWLAARGEREQEACQLALERGLREQARTRSSLTVRVSGIDVQPARRQGELVLALEPALRFLRSPFLVLVEDRDADRAFVFAMAKPEWRERLGELEGRGSLHFEHGGGITRMRDTVRDVARDIADRTRYWVLFDSDSLAPGRRSTDADKLVQACRDRVEFHCLERRAIENYIPMAALLHWAEHAAPGNRDSMKRTARAFRNLQPSQRHHYKMRRGFAGDAGRDDAANAATLFDDLEPGVRQTLQGGFGGEVSEVLSWHGWSAWDSWQSSEPDREETSRMIECLFDCL
jgi:hypothetical protein